MATATSTKVTNVPQLRIEDVTDPALLSVIAHARETKSPPPSFYLTIGHAPEVATAFANYWELTHRAGNVPHKIKELCRIQIAQMIQCEYCARQQSELAPDITEEEIQNCALPSFEHPDPRTRAALHYARTITRMDGREAEVYAELKEHFSLSDIVEMGAFFTLTAGGNRMVKSWGVQPQEAEEQAWHEAEAALPAGAMSMYD